jgi:ubiquinone biosynthesis protein COQ4
MFSLSSRGGPILRGALAARGIYRSVRNPKGLDGALDLLSATRGEAMVRDMVRAMEQSERGRRGLREQPRLGARDLSGLLALPPGSLGRAYGEMIQALELNPYGLPDEPSDSTETWVLAHLLESHDLLHVVYGADTLPWGELVLVGLYMAQIPNRFHALSTLTSLGIPFVMRWELLPLSLEALSRGFLLGRETEPFAGYDWKARLATPLAEVRSELGIPADVEERVRAPRTVEGFSSAAS